MILLGILEHGLIYAVMALGLYITYRILEFPDLTVDGSFPLGAAVTVMLMTNTENAVLNALTLGQNPYVIMLIASLAGSIAGLVTGIIHVKFHVRNLLSGVITMTGLYSINLHIAGRANVPVFNNENIFNNRVVDSVFPQGLINYKVLIIIAIIVILSKISLDLYLKTRSGYLLRAVGDNMTLVTTLAKDSGKVKIVGLIIANCLVSLSGSVMAQQQGFFEITMGTGAMVMGLASVIIGTSLFKKLPIKPTATVIIGAIIYQACISFAMDLELSVVVGIIAAVAAIVFIKKPLALKIVLVVASTVGAFLFSELFISYEISASDMKLITSVLFMIILIISHEKKARTRNVRA